MIHTDKKISSLSTALLLCFGTLVLAAPPEGKGKGGKGNQPVDATASFAGEIMSNALLQGELIDNGDFDTLEGQLAGGETITVAGDAGAGLAELESRHLILPTGASTSCLATCAVTFAVSPDDENSGVTWTIRLDRAKQPPNRVQFKMRWVNAAGFEHHLRIGWVVQAYEDEIYPLPDSDYGEVPEGVSSLESTTVTFDTDFFRIDGKVPTGKGKKTELEVFSRYGEQFDDTPNPPDDPEIRPWCGMGGMAADLTCRESTTIDTALAN